MSVSKFFVAALVALSTISASTMANANEAEKKPAAGGTIKAKLSSDYIALPPMHMAVQVDANRKYRSLEVEVWLLQPDPEKHQVLNSKKKLIAEKVKDDFAAYSWEAFESASGGPEVAKKIVAQSVEQAAGVKADAVLIKTLVLK
jgi:hypothetical protein